MTKALKLDPLALMREGVNRLEGGANAFATQKMQSEQFAQVLAQLIKVSLGVQHVFGKTLAGLYARLDVPSRTELAALAAAVQRIEDKVDSMLSPTPSLVPRPARTRRAPEPVAAAVAEASAPAPTLAPVRRAPARKTAGKAAGKTVAKSGRKPGGRARGNGEARP